MQDTAPRAPQRSSSPTPDHYSESQSAASTAHDSSAALSSATANLASQVITETRSVTFAPDEQLEQIQTIDNFSYPPQVLELAKVNNVLNRVAQKLEQALESGSPVTADVQSGMNLKLYDSRKLIVQVKGELQGLNDEEKVLVQAELMAVAVKFNEVRNNVNNS